MQAGIYDKVIDVVNFPVVEQRYFDMPFPSRHYPHEMKTLAFHGLDFFMRIQQNYSEELIKEFFATIYFQRNEVRTM
jgi:hypothetical protein